MFKYVLNLAIKFFHFLVLYNLLIFVYIVLIIKIATGTIN